jgi:DNA (cytosine-5)-methyltransferase 1
MPSVLHQPIRIGTDCSGMETPLMALKALEVPVAHMFSSDKDKHVKKQLSANFSPKIWFDDIMKRDNQSRITPSVDIYFAGFPCQPFSGAGKRRGFKDKRSGVFFGCVDYIENKRPKVFILENVKRLLSHLQGKTMQKVMNMLESAAQGAYDIQMKVLDTQDHGVPQSRSRVYIVGIRKDCKRFSISFPEPLPKVSIESFLDPAERRPTMGDLPPKTSKTARKNVMRFLKNLNDQGRRPLIKTFTIDHNSSPSRSSCMFDKVMCMTRSRPRGHWITSRGRAMNINEMLRCQGMERCFTQVISDFELGRQIGNAMSQNVLERLLIRVLPAAGLVPPDVCLVDRWAGSRPIKRLHDDEPDFRSCPGVLKCPTYGCSFHVWLDSDDPELQSCPRCGRSSCVRCGAQPYHTGLNCSQSGSKSRRQPAKAVS